MRVLLPHVHGGVIKRATKWLQRVGGEWLWRLIQDPRKIKKVRNLPRFAWRVLREQHQQGSKIQ